MFKDLQTTNIGKLSKSGAVETINDSYKIPISVNFFNLISIGSETKSMLVKKHLVKDFV